MEFMGRPRLPMLPLLFHALQKHGEAWENFSGHNCSRAWVSMEAMGHHFLVINLNIMQKHGKHGTLFLMISNSMGNHEEHGNPFFHELG